MDKKEYYKRIEILRQVTATMAISNMCPDRDFLREMLKWASGEKTTEEIRQKIIDEYIESGEIK